MLRDSTAQGLTQAAQLMALRAGMTAWEAEAVQEGRLIGLAAATTAGLDIQAFGWQAIHCPEPHHTASLH